MTRNELSLHNDLLLRGNRVVIPANLKQEILHKLHVGHQGIVKCRLRAKESVWWPGISDDINTFIHNCDTCCRDFPITTEPMMPTKLPERPWEKLASDLFQFKGNTYIIVVDYFSRYIEIRKLTTTTSASIIAALKTIFARHGIPDVLSLTMDHNTLHKSLTNFPNPTISSINPAARTILKGMGKQSVR